MNIMSNVPRRDASRDGFTIVEVVVAIVILSIGILGLAATAGVVVRQMTGAVPTREWKKFAPATAWR